MVIPAVICAAPAVVTAPPVVSPTAVIATAMTSAAVTSAAVAAAPAVAAPAAAVPGECRRHRAERDRQGHRQGLRGDSLERTHC